MASSAFNNMAAGVQKPPPVCISKLIEELDNRPPPGRKAVIEFYFDRPDHLYIPPFADVREWVRPNLITGFFLPFQFEGPTQVSIGIGSPAPNVPTGILFTTFNQDPPPLPTQHFYQAFMPAKPVAFPQDSRTIPVYNASQQRVGTCRAWIR